MELEASIVFEHNWEALNSDKRFIENMGGSRSSKTYSLCQALIIYMLKNPGTSISIIRKTFPALRASVMRDFFEVLKGMDMYNKSNHNKTEHIYTFSNGSFVEFFSADDEQKLRGRKRDIAWINEANEIWKEDFKQIAMRTTLKIIFDYNPSDANSYLYDLPVEKTYKIHSTYLDNPFLEQEIIDEIESYKDTDEDYYTIFALGLRAFSKENVFSKWKTFKDKPSYLRDYIYGIDFGYNHPTALVKIWYNTDYNELYIEELIYESFLTSTDIVNKFIELGVNQNVPVIADYARPEIMAELRQAGYQVLNAIKDVKDGLNNIKTFKIMLDEQAKNIIKENENYKYKKAKGEITEEVVKLYDDAMDAIRYAVFYIKKYLFTNGKYDGINL